MSQNAVLKVARDYVTAVINNGITVTSAYLFGSYSKNTPHEGSDIDICIVSPELGKDVIDEMMMLNKIGLKIDTRIETHPMSPEDFAEKYNHLAFEIKTHGIQIM